MAYLKEFKVPISEKLHCKKHEQHFTKCVKCKTIDFQKRVLDTLGYTLIGEYHNALTDIIIRCDNCDTETVTRSKNILSGRFQCRTCYKIEQKKKGTKYQTHLNYFHNVVCPEREARGLDKFTLISDNPEDCIFTDSETGIVKYRVKCPKGHISDQYKSNCKSYNCGQCKGRGNGGLNLRPIAKSGKTVNWHDREARKKFRNSRINIW